MPTGIRMYRRLRTCVHLSPLVLLLGCGDITQPIEEHTDRITVHEVPSSSSALPDSNTSPAPHEMYEESVAAQTEECVEGDEMVCNCADPDDDVNYKLISPNGGEVWAVGQEVVIHFCSEYTDTEEVRNCEIALSPDNGITWISLRNRKGWASIAPNKYKWEVEGEVLAKGPGGELKMLDLTDKPLRIRIRTYYGDQNVDWDMNDQPFTIQTTSVSTIR